MFDCLADHTAEETRRALSDLTAAEWQELLDVAGVHRVQPLLARHLRIEPLKAAVPEAVKARLTLVQRETADANAMRCRDFAAAIEALTADGVPVIALKGMQLLPEVYRSLAVRAMIDIDLLVPARKLDAAAAALRRIGYAPAFSYRVSDDPIPYYAHHVPPFRKAGATRIELHWHVVPPLSDRSVDVDGLWKRAVPARVAGVDVLVMSPEDLLLHVCVHAAYDHRLRESARACGDVSAIASRYSISWPDVIDRARAWNSASGTYVVLRLARDLVGARIPPEALEALKPDGFDEKVLDIALHPLPEEDRPGIARLWAVKGVRQKLRTLRSRVFVPRIEIADKHNVDRSSKLVYVFYLLRLWELVTNNWRFVTRFRRARESMTIETFLREEAN
jgi:hypothetical protein